MHGNAVSPDEALAALVGALPDGSTPIAIIGVNEDGSFALRALGAVRDQLANILAEMASKQYDNERAGSRVQ